LKTLFPALLALATLAGCGATPCDALNTANDAFFAGKTECKYTSGSSSISLTKSGKCSDTSKCSAADLKTLDTYASCLSKAQVCTTGNEQKATSDATACALAAFGGLSADCQAAIK
jgi:hypothetical protein